MEKYGEHYLEHYLVCFSTLGYEENDNDFYELARTYIQIEGQDAFHKLIDEINQIEASNDWDTFVENNFNNTIDKVTVQKIADIAKDVYKTLHD